MRVIELEFGDQLGEWPRRFVSKPLQVVDVLRLLRTAAKGLERADDSMVIKRGP